MRMFALGNVLAPGWIMSPVSAGNTILQDADMIILPHLPHQRHQFWERLMFNAEKLLGGLILGSRRGSRTSLGGLLSGGAALGLLGVAMEAVEHYLNKPQQDGVKPPPLPGSVPPPPPPQAMGGRPAVFPPPPPPSSGSASAHSPSAAAGMREETDEILLIRAMIAAANADGAIDQAERKTILEQLQEVELSTEEQAFIVKELLVPADMEAIVGAVATPALAEQVYTVSLMAIDVDTEAERRYLATLANRLGLDRSTVETIHHRLGME